MSDNQSFLANDHGLKLTSVDTAMDAIGSGMGACIFTADDLSPGFFDLKNRLAGEVFQKFVNYGFKAAFIVPDNHSFGERVTELMRDHRNHPTIRFFPSVTDAHAWLSSLE